MKIKRPDRDHTGQDNWVPGATNGWIMQLRHLNTLTQPATGEGGDGVKMSKVMAVAWAPNNRKLAVCTVR